VDETGRRKILKLQRGTCPVCLQPVSWGDALHHWLVGRMKGCPELDEWPNVVLVHNDRCHVPPPEGMTYKCARYMFTRVGLSPDYLKSWRDGLPLKVKPAFPAEYHRAERDVFGV
jgi:hypothetical protein